MLFSILFLLLLNHRPLNNPDESRYSEIAFEMLRSGDFVTPRFNGVLFLDKPPLYYWLQASAITLFGHNNGSLRFFPALFALFGAFNVYHTCKHLFNKHTALLASAILLSSPLYFFIGLYANLDMEVAVLISNALLFFSMAVFAPLTPKKISAYYYAAYLSVALAILTKGLIGIVLPALSIGIWLILTGQLKRLSQFRIPSGLCLVLLINAPWYYLVEQANPGFLHFFFYEQQFTRFIGHQFNAQNPFYFYPCLILAGMFPWSVFSLQALYVQTKKTISAFRFNAPSKPRIKSTFDLTLITPQILLYFICWLVSITVFFSLPASKLASYIIPALPPLAILMAHYLTTEGMRNRLVPLALWTMFIISALLLSAVFYAMDTLILPAIGSKIVVVALSILVMVGVICCRIKTRSITHILYSISASLLCFLLTASVPYWIEFIANKKPTIASTQILAKIINKTPKLPIYSYKSFYYDLPILLKHPLIVVEKWQTPGIENIDSWIGKFAWGQKKEGITNPYLMLPNPFWRHWHNTKRKVLVITRTDNLKDFKRYVLIKKHKRNALISNR